MQEPNKRIQSPKYQRDVVKVAPFGILDINRLADFLICYDASAPFKMQFDDNPETPWEKGLSLESPTSFKKVIVRNETDAVLTVDLGFGSGGIKDNRFVFSGRIETDTPAPGAGRAIEQLDTASGVSTPLVGADPLRKEVLVQNLSASGAVYIRSDANEQFGGIYVGPGGAASLNTSAALWVYQASGAVVPVVGMEFVGDLA